MYLLCVERLVEPEACIILTSIQTNLVFLLGLSPWLAVNFKFFLCLQSRLYFACSKDEMSVGLERLLKGSKKDDEMRVFSWKQSAHR